MTFRGAVRDVTPIKGIYNAAPPQAIPEGYCFDACNVRFLNESICPRDAFYPLVSAAVKPGTLTEAPTGLYQAFFSGGVSRIVCTIKNKVYVVNSTTWDDITGTATVTNDANVRFSFASLNDTAVGTNGTAAPLKFTSTGNAAALGGTPPSKAKAILSFRNRLLMGNTDLGEGVVEWSGLNNPEVWSGTGSGSATPALNTGQSIIGMAAVGSEAFLFFDRSIWRIIPRTDPNAPFEFVEHASGVGAVSPQSIVSVPDASSIFFVGRRGVYKMQAPGYSPKLVSSPVDAWWAPYGPQYVAGGTIPSVDYVNLTKSIGVHNAIHSEVWFGIQQSYTNDIVMVYNYERNTWSRFGGSQYLRPNCFATYLSTLSGLSTVLHGAATYGVFTHEPNTGAKDDLGDTTTFPAVVSTVTSRAHSIVDGIRTASVRQIQIQSGVYATSGSSELVVTYDHDLANRYGQSYTASLVGTSAIGQVTNHINTTGTGPFFQYKLSHTPTTTNRFNITGIQLGIIPEGTGQIQSAQ